MDLSGEPLTADERNALRAYREARSMVKEEDLVGGTEVFIVVFPVSRQFYEELGSEKRALLATRASYAVSNAFMEVANAR